MALVLARGRHPRAAHLPAGLRAHALVGPGGLGGLPQGRAARLERGVLGGAPGRAPHPGGPASRAGARRAARRAWRRYDLSFDHEADEPPTFLSFSHGAVTFQDRPPSLSVVLLRPDGTEVPLLRSTERADHGRARSPLRAPRRDAAARPRERRPGGGGGAGRPLRRGIRRRRSRGGRRGRDQPRALQRRRTRTARCVRCAATTRPRYASRWLTRRTSLDWVQARGRRLRLRPDGHGWQWARPGRGPGLRPARGAPHRHRRGDREHGHRHGPGAALGLQGRTGGPRHPASRGRRQQRAPAATAHLLRVHPGRPAVAHPAAPRGLQLARPDHPGALHGPGPVGQPGGRGSARAGRLVRPHPAAAHLPAHGPLRVHAAHLLRAGGHPGRGRPLVPGPGRSDAADLGPGPRGRLPHRAPCSWATGGGSSRPACSSSSRP